MAPTCTPRNSWISMKIRKNSGTLQTLHLEIGRVQTFGCLSKDVHCYGRLFMQEKWRLVEVRGSRRQTIFLQCSLQQNNNLRLQVLGLHLKDLYQKQEGQQQIRRHYAAGRARRVQCVAQPINKFV